MKLLFAAKTYMPSCYPYEIRKDGTLEYFISGKGWQKTKAFKIKKT